MKNIKTYEDFVNEEINLKKALATGALAAGMAFSNPAMSQVTQNKDTILPQRVNTPLILKRNNIGKVSIENDVNGYYLDKDNIWHHLEPYDTINNKPQLKFPSYSNMLNTNAFLSSEEIIEYNKVLITTVCFFRNDDGYQYTSIEKRYFLIDKNDFKSISNLDINKTYIFNLIDIFNYSKDATQIEVDKAIKACIDDNKKPSYKLYIKVGYVDGKKIVRFAITYSDINFENSYYEIPYDIFSKFLMK